MIRRIKNRKRPFVMVDSSILENPDMSWKAKGLLCYFLSRPDDWRFKMDDLKTRSTDGRDATWTAIQELRENGYVKWTKIKDPETGKQLGTEWNIFESPHPENPDNPTPKVQTVIGSPPKGGPHNTAGQNISQIFENEYLDDLSTSSKLCSRFREFYITNRLYVGKKAPNQKLWARACNSLLEELEGDSARIWKVMRWYFKHFREPYVPTCYAMTTFCQQFVQIEKAMCRATGDPGPSPKKVQSNSDEEWSQGPGAPSDEINEIPI